MSSPLVSVEDVHLSLVGGAGKVNILRGIDLELAAGETLSIIGASGAGKTTLLMALAGLERVSSGHIRIAGTEISCLNEDALARFRRHHIGIVFQSFHLVPTMTALENVALPLEFAGSADASLRAAEALALTGLSERRHHYPGELSGGEQQRVALARAFVASPRLILADEPTGNLDADNGRRVMDLLFHLQEEQGTSLLLITHDLELAGRCGRQLHMADGRLSLPARVPA